MKKITIASLQLKVHDDKYENIEKLAEIIAGGAADGADIISLPEMWNCPYKTENFPVYAEPGQGDSWLALSTLARKNGKRTRQDGSCSRESGNETEQSRA